MLFFQMSYKMCLQILRLELVFSGQEPIQSRINLAIAFIFGLKYLSCNANTSLNAYFDNKTK